MNHHYRTIFAVSKYIKSKVHLLNCGYGKYDAKLAVFFFFFEGGGISLDFATTPK